MTKSDRKSADAQVDIVHLYSQTTWHSSAVISGSRTGLECLRSAIDAALTGGTGCADVMTDDCEGYSIAVMLEGPQTLEDLDGRSGDRGLPYSDEIAASPPKMSFWDRVAKVISEKKAGRR